MKANIHIIEPASSLKTPVRYDQASLQSAFEPANDIFGDVASPSYLETTPSLPYGPDAAPGLPQAGVQEQNGAQDDATFEVDEVDSEAELDFECDSVVSDEDFDTLDCAQDAALGFRDDEDDKDEVDEDGEGQQAASDDYAYDNQPDGPKRKATYQKTGARAPKAARVPETSKPAKSKTAEEYVHYLNQVSDLSEDDEMVKRGRQMLNDWYAGFREWVGTLAQDWYKLPPEQKGISMWAVNLIKRLEPRDIERLLCGWIPFISLAALGKSVDEGLSAFLDLPKPSREIPFRCTYFNAATDIGLSNVMIGTSPYTGRQGVKLPKNQECLKQARKVKGYWGATARAIADRLNEHENNTEKGRNYTFLQQPGVVSNWRMFAIFDMPEVKDLSGQDPGRLLPFFMEGTLMSLTNTATKTNQPARPNSSCSDEGYALSGMLRANVKDQAPDFSDRSLNIAWSLNQGLRGARIRKCANPMCLISHRKRDPVAKKLPYYMAVGSLIPMETGDGSVYPKSFCPTCVRYYQDPETKGQWYNRYDSVNLVDGFNHWPKSINDWWIQSSAGRARQCNNCSVSIPKDASMFGLMNDIRCFRCAHFRVREKSEWIPERDTVKPPSETESCDGCGKVDKKLTLRSDLDRISICIPKNYKGTQWICLGCDNDWVVYGPRQHSRNTTMTQTAGGTKLEKQPIFCHELNCKTFLPNEQRGLWNLTHLVHDTQQDVWRCLACDFDYCEEKRKSNPNFCKEDTHHANKKQECSVCARWYTFFSTWHPDQDGLVKCGECADRKCWNKHCDQHKSAATYLVYSERLGHRYCRFCHDYLSRNKNSEAHFQRKQLSDRMGPNAYAEHLHSTTGAKLECGNANCRTTSGGRTWNWLPNTTASDPSLLRCYNCHMYRYKKGVERPRPNAKEYVAGLGGSARCGNCSTETSGTWHWRPKSTIADPVLLRCKDCYTYTSRSRKDLERPSDKWE